MPGKVIRFSDYDRRDPDAVSPRDPADTAVVIILPMIRIERPQPEPIKRKAKRAAK